MPRKCQDIQQYEKEILELKEKGLSRKEIGEKIGISAEQVHYFTKRYNKKQRMLEAGIVPRARGRRPKDYVVSKEEEAAKLRYALAQKEEEIRRLEMENELMRDFLSLTGRK